MCRSAKVVGLLWELGMKAPLTFGNERSGGGPRGGPQVRLFSSMLGGDPLAGNATRRATTAAGGGRRRGCHHFSGSEFLGNLVGVSIVAVI